MMSECTDQSGPFVDLVILRNKSSIESGVVRDPASYDNNTTIEGQGYDK